MDCHGWARRLPMTGSNLDCQRKRESVMQMMLFIMSCCLLKYLVFWVIYTCFAQVKIHGLRAILLAAFVELWRRAVRALVWYNGVRRRDALMPVVVLGVCDARWSASTGWPSMRSCSDYHACRHGVISCVNALHVKPCFHCRVPFSMTWASAASMKMMRSLFSCPRHGTGNLYQLAWRTWPR